MTKIVARFARIRRSCGLKLAPWQRRTLLMDLNACHSNGCPLDLKRLLDAPQFDFIHDVGGIAHHIDRTTGQLTDYFTPRYAKKIAEAMP